MECYMNVTRRLHKACFIAKLKFRLLTSIHNNTLLGINAVPLQLSSCTCEKCLYHAQVCSMPTSTWNISSYSWATQTIAVIRRIPINYVMIIRTTEQSLLHPEKTRLSHVKINLWSAGSSPSEYMDHMNLQEP